MDFYNIWAQYLERMIKREKDFACEMTRKVWDP